MNATCNIELLIWRFCQSVPVCHTLVSGRMAKRWQKVRGDTSLSYVYVI